jgi:hypothetical protein
VLGVAFLILCRCCGPLPCCCHARARWSPAIPSAPAMELMPRPFGRESDLRDIEMN